MHLVYSTLAIAEVVVLFASAFGVMFLVGRVIVLAFAKPTEETKRVPREQLQHLKRAGQSGFY